LHPPRNLDEKEIETLSECEVRLRLATLSGREYKRLIKRLLEIESEKAHPEKGRGIP